jgi:hypothetical protein
VDRAVVTRARLIAFDLVVYCVNREAGWQERNAPVVVEGVIDYTERARARTGSDRSIGAGTDEPVFQMACDLVH